MFQDLWGNHTPSARAAMEQFYQNRSVILWDFTFLYMPTVDGSGPADTLAGVYCLVAVGRFAILPGPLSMRWVLLKRAPRCRIPSLPVPLTTFKHNGWLEAFALLPGMGTLFGDQGTCNDVLFSGHTAMGTVFTLFVSTYSEKGPYTSA